ncbi:MAG TPA: bifunctional phosphopantothenoylcysteine decarboxylase/phosphopantothenate--cysteine ligase CoaBC [Archaeoglobus profundus]|nr:bifunctional phosphopantothenoylcysteine decarboxylase/phosphopantothenate--cysteine ligase CoaBC [Archaeoglobus profundus]
MLRKVPIMKRLEGKSIVLGVTGSIAAIECVKLARELRRRGAKVKAVMSRDARKIIHPNALAFATDDEVITEIRWAEHVKLKYDLLLIAPATANTIAKIANGICDTPVTLMALTALGAKKPVVIAPAMDGAMFNAIKDKLEKLRENVTIVPPRFEEGKAKMASIEEICLFVEKALYPKDLAGKKVVVTSGPTYEYLDPIRFISNRSSGRMGNELALECWRRGADVVLITSRPLNMNLFKQIKVTSVLDMLKAVLSEVKDADLFISAAAPSDFIVEASNTKIKTQELMIKLKVAPKIIKEVRKVFNGHIIGFKAETGLSDEELIRVAEEKMVEDKLEMVVANDVKERGMGTEDTRVVVVTGKRREWIEGDKSYVAKKIIDIYVEDCC